MYTEYYPGDNEININYDIECSGNDCRDCPYNPRITGRDCFDDSEGCCKCQIIINLYNPNIPAKYYSF